MIGDDTEQDGDAPNRDHTSLSRTDRELIFKEATRGFALHYRAQIKTGMCDGELWRALESSLGIFGGSGGPGRPSVTYKGAGLKIWGAWSTINHVTTPPLFAGAATVAMAREVYGISDPETEQLSLL